MKKFLVLPIIVSVIFILSFLIHDAHATSFTATQSGNWNDSTTWGGSSPPTTINSSDTVTIPSGITVTIPSSVAISNSGTVSNAGTINNNSGGNIYNFGTITNHSGATINNLGTITNLCGGIIKNSGTISGNPVTNGCHHTATYVAPNPSSAALSGIITFHVKVRDTSSSPTIPVGIVSWSDGGAGGHFSSSSCTLMGGSNTCSLVYTAPSSTGPVTIKATYQGDSTHMTSSGTSSLTVTLRSTSTIVAPNPSSVVHASNIKFKAKVTDTSTGTKNLPTGTVSWGDGGAGGVFSSPSCTLTPLSSSSSTCDIVYTAPLSTGPVTITATYSGDSTHKTSSGNHQINTAQCITPPSNLVGWWSGDGNTNDLAGSHTGTISGGVTFAPGKVSQAFSFDGTGSVGVGSLGINSDTQPFSIVAWINPSASAVSGTDSTTIVAEGDQPNGFGNGEYFTNLSLLGANGLGAITIEIGATQIYSEAKHTLPIIKPNQWSLVAVTYDGSRTAAGVKIYVNGVEQTTTNFGSGFTLTGSPRDQWAIGSQISVLTPFSGLIDETEIFNRAITQQEIQSEFNADSAGKCKPGGGPPTVIATIPVGASATNVVVNPNTNTLYLSDEADGKASVINANTNTVTATIPIGTFPVGLAVNPNTNKVYIQSYATLSVLDGNTNTITATLSNLGYSRYGVALNPNTNTVYVTSNSDNLLYVLNGTTNTVITNIPVGNDDSYDAVNPSTNTIYVSNYLDNTVSVINGNTNTVTATVPVGNVPYYLAANPNTNAVYVVNSNDNTVSVIDGNTNTVTATIPVGSGPIGVAVNPLTNTIYVANGGSNTVSVISGITNTVTATIPGFNVPFSIALNLVTNNIYVVNVGNSTISVLH